MYFFSEDGFCLSKQCTARLMPHYVAFHLDIHCCHCLGVLVFKGVSANKKGIVDVKFSLYSVIVEATF